VFWIKQVRKGQAVLSHLGLLLEGDGEAVDQGEYFPSKFIAHPCSGVVLGGHGQVLSADVLPGRGGHGKGAA